MAKINNEGLTFPQWRAAATFGTSRMVVTASELKTFRKAWEAGEDPTEYAAEREKRMPAQSDRRYTVQDLRTNEAALGLIDVSSENALVQRLVPAAPISSLTLYGTTYARESNQPDYQYLIIRTV